MVKHQKPLHASNKQMWSLKLSTVEISRFLKNFMWRVTGTNFYTAQTSQTQMWARQAEWPVECLNPVTERFPETRPKELWQGKLIMCLKKLNMFIPSFSSLLLGIQPKKIIGPGNKDLCVKSKKSAPGFNRWQAVCPSRKRLSFSSLFLPHSPLPHFYVLLRHLPPPQPLQFFFFFLLPFLLIFLPLFLLSVSLNFLRPSYASWS